MGSGTRPTQTKFKKKKKKKKYFFFLRDSHITCCEQVMSFSSMDDGTTIPKQDYTSFGSHTLLFASIASISILFLSPGLILRQAEILPEPVPVKREKVHL